MSFLVFNRSAGKGRVNFSLSCRLRFFPLQQKSLKPLLNNLTRAPSPLFKQFKFVVQHFFQRDNSKTKLFLS